MAKGIKYSPYDRVNQKKSNDFSIELKKWSEKVVGEKTTLVAKRFAEILLKNIQESIPVGTPETSSIYPGFARDSWKIRVDGNGISRIYSDVGTGYNYNWVLEFGGNPWTKPEGTKHLTPEGFSTQAPTGFLRLAYEKSRRELIESYSRL